MIVSQESRLTPEEEAFPQAVLWEEGHLIRGGATRAAEEHGLPIIRCLEPANYLSPNLHGEALAQLRKQPYPSAKWPWPGMGGEEVLRTLWARMQEVAEDDIGT